MEQLHNWDVKRAGSTLTLRYKTPNTEGMITGIERVFVNDGKVIATDKTGHSYQLVV